MFGRREVQESSSERNRKRQSRRNKTVDTSSTYIFHPTEQQHSQKVRSHSMISYYKSTLNYMIQTYYKVKSQLRCENQQSSQVKQVRDNQKLASNPTSNESQTTTRIYDGLNNPFIAQQYCSIYPQDSSSDKMINPTHTSFNSYQHTLQENQDNNINTHYNHGNRINGHPNNYIVSNNESIRFNDFIHANNGNSNNYNYGHEQQQQQQPSKDNYQGGYTKESSNHQAARQIQKGNGYNEDSKENYKVSQIKYRNNPLLAQSQLIQNRNNNSSRKMILANKRQSMAAAAQAIAQHNNQNINNQQQNIINQEKASPLLNRQPFQNLTNQIISENNRNDDLQKGFIKLNKSNAVIMDNPLIEEHLGSSSIQENQGYVQEVKGINQLQTNQGCVQIQTNQQQLNNKPSFEQETQKITQNNAGKVNNKKVIEIPPHIVQAKNIVEQFFLLKPGQLNQILDGTEPKTVNSQNLMYIEDYLKIHSISPTTFTKEYFNSLIIQQQDVAFCLQRHKISSRARSRMIDWMIQVITFVFKKPNISSLFKAIHILDLFLKKSKTVLEDKSIHLIGVCCLIISNHLDQCQITSLNQFYAYVAHQSFEKKELIAMEIEILKTIDFDLNFSIVSDFHNQYIFFLKKTKKINQFYLNDFIDLSYYYLLMSYFYEDMLCFQPRIISLSALFLALENAIGLALTEKQVLTFDLSSIKQDILCEFNVGMKELMPCLEQCMSYLKNIIRHINSNKQLINYNKMFGDFIQN